MRFGAIELFTYMGGFKIIHILIDKFCNGDFRQITMRFIANESHRENVTQSRCDEMRILRDQQFEALSKIFVGCHGV